MYQLASGYLEKLSTQTATQNARELGSLVAGSAITAGIGKIAGSGLSFLSDLGKVGLPEEVVLSARPIGSTSSVNALKQKTILALQEAGILDANEELTESAVSSSRRAMARRSTISNPSVIEALTSDGSLINDWTKRTTETVQLPSGQKIQVHFYQNEYTGEVNYTHQDYKVKGVVSAFPGSVSPDEIVNEYSSLSSLN